MGTTTWTRALITGASSGIGAELTRQLAAQGTDLVVVARSTAALESLADELRRANDVEVEVLTADLTAGDDLERVAARLGDETRPVDLLVNNAGMGTTGPFAEQDPDRNERLLQLNIAALVRLTHAAVPVMVERGHGGILNTSSLGGFQPVPQMSVYAASKAFVTSFSEAIHEELAGTGVHVTALAPGFTRTNFVNAADADDEAAKLPGRIWMQAPPVAAAGLRAVGANRAVVVPGLHYKLTSAATRTLPSAVTRRFISLASRLGR